MRRALAALALSAILSAPLPAPAQDTAIIDASDPDRILEIARGFGSAALEVDDVGDPVIRGRFEGKRYSVYFYGCEEGKNCQSIQFWTYFEGNAKTTVDSANAFNKEWRLSRVYIDDEGDMILNVDVNLVGGVTRRNLDDTFDWWTYVMREARTVFEGEGGGAIPPASGEAADPPGLQKL